MIGRILQFLLCAADRRRGCRAVRKRRPDRQGNRARRRLPERAPDIRVIADLLPSYLLDKMRVFLRGVS